MIEKVEWSTEAVDHMFAGHQVTPEQASEAVNDVEALWFDPDPKSKSGKSVRVIGYSHSARAVLTVVLLPADSQLDDRGWHGVNGWRSNTTDKRKYGKGVQGGD